MDAETISAIKALFEEYSAKDGGTVTAAYLTVGGMLGVAILGAISQWLISRHVVAEEHRRLSIQLRSEFQARRHEKWEAQLLDAITDLLKVTDPEINVPIDPTAVTPCVLRVQLLLNPDNPIQAEVNSLVNQLALTANGWLTDHDPLPILKVHGGLLEKARVLFYRPE